MKENTNITYNEFKNTDIFKSAVIIEFVNANGQSSFDHISDEALGSMIVKDYNYSSGYLEIVLREEENNMLEKLVGRRYANLELLKNDIETLTGKTISTILESESERFEDMDFMIDFEFEEFDIHTIFYLKDNGNNYYITEV